MRALASLVLRSLLWPMALGAVMLGSVPAYAQEDVVYKKKTVVDFSGETIDGNLSKPDGAYLDAQKRQRHQKLIKVRETFRAEVLQTVLGL